MHFRMSKGFILMAKHVATKISPLHSRNLEEKITQIEAYLLFCPPPWPEAKKKSFAKQMNFFPGVGMIFFDPVSNFQCATPRGLIRLLTVGGNLPQIALLVEAILRRVARSLPHSVLYQRKALGATFAMVHPAFSISCIFKPYFCIS